MVTNRELIEAALDSLHPLRRDDGVKFGNVSAAVASRSGRIYQGVNLFTPAGAAQICAEKMAFGAMATAGEYEAAKVVAVWRPQGGHDAHVVPPCGWCREFISQLAPAGLEPHRDRRFDVLAVRHGHHVLGEWQSLAQCSRANHAFSGQ
jgi:cytidine deaminase